ncbi:hypothetical protein ASG25_02880 [Rhizobium sp. Leaf384]|uniref:Wzz/FepE/Etk N-terminal domain-containing protein n=1 Tax=unclassified Rhizobium TaxID=2613769 RepID=UPI0007147FC6|nr:MULTISPECIES: Wzz/FepE/Etk N-terminal domain-containing protein [unclassified Rhizobium]KQS80545.1 hypothetical protein ASG25_02880 [Rhizobium sp. Leaf384]KQS86596.1 hypothetical protein ASG58_17955 [Rhizobium sp. Leaf383]
MTDAKLGYNMMSFDSAPTIVNELREFMSILRRRGRLILLMAPLGLVVGYAASYLITPVYTATAQLSLDPRRIAIAQPVNAQTQRRDEPLIDSGRADTEVQTIRSESVIRSVVTSLDLQNEPEFTKASTGVVAKLKILAGLQETAPPLGEEDRILVASAAVAKKLTVERVDKSYAYSITFKSENPDLAARIANGFAETYIKKQLDADYDATGQAVAWLKEKSESLSVDLDNAERAASAYQKEARIATSDGKLVDEQQLEKLGEQLSDATAQRVEAQARYEGSLQFSPSSVGELATTDSFQNSVISKLRTEYVEIKNRAAALASRYGENHIAVQKLNSDAEAIENSIRAELLRYQTSYKNDFDVAQAREKSIRDALNAQMDKAADTSSTRVRLKSLEANAAGLRAAYEGFMQRYTESMQRQSFPVSEARVISEAMASTSPSNPKRSLFGLGGLALGLIGGIAGAYTLEVAFRRIRTRNEAETATGVECFGYFPKVDKLVAQGHDRQSKPGLPIDYVRTEPFSVATETLRTVRTTFEMKNKREACPVLALTSCFPNEGKTSLCGNLGFLFASKNKRILLVDGDVRNPSLSNKLQLTDADVRPEERVMLANGVSVVRRAGLGFDFLSMVETGRINMQKSDRSNNEKNRRVVASLEPDFFGELIETAKEHYDCILIDLPPIVPLSDVRAVSEWITSFVLVLSWGQSEMRAVNDALETAPAMADKLIGSILNFADLKVLPRYGEHFAAYYNSDYFNR